MKPHAYQIIIIIIKPQVTESILLFLFIKKKKFVISQQRQFENLVVATSVRQEALELKEKLVEQLKEEEEAYRTKATEIKHTREIAPKLAIEKV